MNRIVIVDCLRTPMGRSKNGSFRNIRAEDLSAHLMHGILTKYPQLDPTQIEDIYWGCVQQTLEQGFNIARNAALLAGLPHTIAAVSVNRLCGSSMQALHDATRAIMVGDAEICLAGGVEHMGHIPMTHGVDLHPQLSHHVAKASALMGITAEVLANQFSISREDQDIYALNSHQKAANAADNGFFNQEILPIPGHNNDGALVSVQTDEVIRSDASFEQLQSLPPAFDPKGSVTAGSSSALSDGASIMLLMSENKAKQLKLPIRAYIKSMAVAGCEPATMGLGLVPATHKALKRAHLNLKDIDVIELNEAFAAQTIACIQSFKLTPEDVTNKLNINGGAIALGHPLGCSGTRICTTLINALEQKQKRYGLATMCIGLGQGIATIFERP
ncbi:acetyl-CoA C-acyltransferase FadA [Vibrio nitrifigilis]|uniref:acetyl-CoA C-acyltransferase n=1 Tax=Vibrio nitrifigilis TaxID=2789781 RepID=A0ABS0GF39_9VIBR|nr:acetyl-CoA C-acyltransferase FadA [Vibrio nitrifigilis]MBF9001029.1 acetyl-CoA C-acyltransferase FadA [Vibrio nitrifigilis]